jgi:hypothetical protein
VTLFPYTTLFRSDLEQNTGKKVVTSDNFLPSPKGQNIIENKERESGFLTG